MNILLRISYDGTAYCGWQRQPNVATVQGEVEKTLAKIFHQPIDTLGAGRTDSGVHALGQCATFVVDKVLCPVEKLPLLLNARLPKDIVIKDAIEVPHDFHPRYSAKRKTYEYKILNAEYRNPMLQNYTEYVRIPLDYARMKEAVSYFLGTHDFKAFSAVGGTVRTSIRTIFDCSLSKEIVRSDDMFTLRITGDSFLYNMVRIIGGTLIDVGKGKKNPEQIKEIILSKDRKKASKTASAAGLTLIDIQYPIL